MRARAVKQDDETRRDLKGKEKDRKRLLKIKKKREKTSKNKKREKTATRQYKAQQANDASLDILRAFSTLGTFITLSLISTLSKFINVNVELPR